MRKSGFTETQVLGVFNEGDADTWLVELTRKHGASRRTCFTRRLWYGGVTANELRRIEEPEAKNAEL